jgi:hypothetical protein
VCHSCHNAQARALTQWAGSAGALTVLFFCDLNFLQSQVQLDEDEGSDADSDFGGGVEGDPAPPPPPAQETQKVSVALMYAPTRWSVQQLQLVS